MTGRAIGSGRALVRALAICLAALLLADPLRAQTTPLPPTGFAAPPSQSTPDYEAWEARAARIEEALSREATSNDLLEQARAEVVSWRQQFLTAQGADATRIATLREQLDALGPAPAEGETEAPEISARRADLTLQLNQLQAPGIKASVAYRRADGLVREIDRILRDRQASALIALWPSPVNPANWPHAFSAIKDNIVRIGEEVRTSAAHPDRIAALHSRLPGIILLVAVGLLLILRSSRLMERLLRWLPEFASPRWVMVWSLPISAAQFILPVSGLALILFALQSTGMLGVLGSTAASSLAVVGFLTVSASWLGRRTFPKDDLAPSALRLGATHRRDGRYIATVMGLMVGLEALRDAMISAADTGDAAAAVLSFPIIVVAGLALVLVGGLLRRHVAHEEAQDAARGFQLRFIGLLGRATMAIGLIGPAIAAVGYVPAAIALVFPTIISLALLALLFILQHLVEDVYNLLTGRSQDDTGALFPVLIGFFLSFAALPVLALVWGARVEDLVELWTAFRRGFSIGETQISPASFLVFGVIFALGYTLTRLLQSTVRTTVLPRTKMDIGGQNAIVAGIGYVGIFLAGLIAINSAGINLAGLAIVAGALSVGIGFGLQNIVQNFVSGIILLVERPISEGDWIEVAGVQGIVQSISVRSTRIQTFDRTDVIVPNADLVSGQVTNFTGFNLTGRLIIPVAVSFNSDSRHVERVLREIAEAEPLVVLNPAPSILFAGFGADALNFEIRVILRDVNFSLGVRSAINHEIMRRFRLEGIEIPFPQRDVRILGTDAAPAGDTGLHLPGGAGREAVGKMS